jgi:anti-anti-sigma factor
MSFTVTIDPFDAVTGTASVTLKGELDASSAGQFKEAIDQVASRLPKALVLQMQGLSFMASAGLRVLIFAKQKLGGDVPLTLVGCQAPVLGTLEMSGFADGVHLQEAL